MCKSRRFIRLIVLSTISVASLIFVAVAMGGVLEDQLHQKRSQGKQVKKELSVIQARQQRTVNQISSLNQRIAVLQVPVDRLDEQVNQLTNRIKAREDRIEKLKQDYRRQAKDIERLTKEFKVAQDQFETRAIVAYKNGDAGVLAQIASAGNLRDLFEQREALGQVLGLDQEVVDKITNSQRDLRLKRANNHQIQRDVKKDIKKLETDRVRVNAKQADLQAKVDVVATVKHTRDVALRNLNSRENYLDQKLENLEEDARVLKQAIETGQVAYSGQTSGPTPAGLIWPVSGAVVSPFGHRWGRMHEGVDIAISSGNPIHAAASGVVTYASWMSGYGNMVLIQHGGGLVTGYAHQSQIAVTVGQPVTQGQVIGFVGCTGHCFGPHVHFETRIGTTPVDPMRYL